MANLPETPQWEEGIYQIEVSDPVLGGPDGISNRQGKQLASRTLYLKQQVEKGGTDLAKHIAAADPHTQYAPKASPTFTGTPTAPTPANSDNSKKLATTEFVAKALAALAGSAPETLDTLKELADALGNDPNFATTVLNKLAEKLAKDQNGADIPDPALFVKNLGLHETGFATLTTSGSFTVPAGVTELCISAVAGGGGGGSGGGGDSSFFGGGGGSGGAGESVVKRKFAVTPGTVINITIGSGGVGSIASTATGSAPTAGGNTVIGSLITLHGGQPGINAGNGQTTAPGGGYGQGFPTGSYGGDGNLNVGSGNGAPGASSPFGGGGGAGRAGTDQGTDGSAGSGYGSGGGSGGGKYGTGSFVARGGNGGNGAPGIVMIEW